MRVIQTAVGAAQFTGLAGAGLVTFSGLPVPADNPDAAVMVQTIALETEEQIPEFFCRFLGPGEALSSLVRVTVIRPLDAGSPTATQGFSKLGCGLYVPKAPTGFYSLVLTTVGKTLDATFTVEYTTGWRPGAIPNK